MRSGVMQVQHPRRRLGLLDAYVAIAVLAVAAARLVPFHRLGGLYACPLLAHTGVPCASCGFTRSFARAAHLDLGGAFQVSPLGTVLFLGVAAFALFGLLRAGLGWPWPRPRLGARGRRLARAGVVGVVLANWTYLLIRHLVIGDWA